MYINDINLGLEQIKCNLIGILAHVSSEEPFK